MCACRSIFMASALLQHGDAAAGEPLPHGLVGEDAPLALRHGAEHGHPLADLPGTEAGAVDALVGDGGDRLAVALLQQAEELVVEGLVDEPRLRRAGAMR